MPDAAQVGSLPRMLATLSDNGRPPELTLDEVLVSSLAWESERHYVAREEKERP